MKAKVTPDGRVSLPAEARKRHGLVVAQAKAGTRRLLADRPGTSVDDFLADRRREAEQE